TLTVRGEGNAGYNNGPAGDLYVDIVVRPHHFFERDGYDIHCEVPLTFAQAALGAEIDVMTLDGVQKVKVAAGTQPGDRQTIKNKGVQRLNGRGKGDQIIHFNVTVPKSLNEKQRQLIRDMDAALPKQTAKKGFFNN
ncbi:MAG: molecular chaperone DnaJ, partial [Clostridia bacterium]|nr:molecular chaperone DnaJ [Clostridia bacterium]